MSTDVDQQRAQQRRDQEQTVSLEIAIVLFAIYVLTLVFSLKTHRHLYDVETQPAKLQEPVTEQGGAHWSPKAAMCVLIGATLVVGLMSELLVGAIEVTSERFGWSEMFVGVVVIAIVGNAAEHSSAVLVAMKNRMDLSIQIAIGSALQIALFVAPVLVFVSYLPIFPERLKLMFTMLEVVAVAVSVMIVGLVAYDGQSNWLEGLLLLAVYVILAIAIYHLPQSHSAVSTTGNSVSSIHASTLCARFG